MKGLNLIVGQVTTGLKVGIDSCFSIRDTMLKNGLSNICGRQPIKFWENMVCLTYFSSVLPFCTPLKHQKCKGFVVFSGDIKWKHWPATSKNRPYYFTFLRTVFHKFYLVSSAWPILKIFQICNKTWCQFAGFTQTILMQLSEMDGAGRFNIEDPIVALELICRFI